MAGAVGIEVISPDTDGSAGYIQTRFVNNNGFDLRYFMSAEET